MKQYFLPVLILLGGVGLLGAAVDSGLPDGYWGQPEATKGEAPHDWSKLETNLAPEACAQCHAVQFDAWKHSLHAAAYSPGMIGQFPAMGHEDANDCLQCHAPLAEQLYTSQAEMLDSIDLRLKHPQGFDSGVALNAVKDDIDSKLPLRHAGVTCASCHVRNWQRFGPPPKASMAVGYQASEAHGGFTATRDFKQSKFCASCHQFPQSMAINGKPLENTLEEWKQSSFSGKGITCQQCHMPDRRHEFRGIHDPVMVRKGLDFSLELRGDNAVLAMTSKWIGHAFPTYVTPKVLVRAEALDADDKIRRVWRWEIVREVYYENGWQEKQDTRLMPGERREFTASAIPAEALHIRFQVNVIPDFFYKGLYQDLLSGELRKDAKQHIMQAVKKADENDYLLYEKVLPLPSSR